MLRLPWLLSFALMLAGLPALAVEPPSGPDEIEAAFKWIETLDLPNVRGCKYVEVQKCRNRSARGYDLKYVLPPVLPASVAPSCDTIEGFILREDDTSFTLYTNYLHTLTFDKPALGKPAQQTFTCEPRAFEDATLREKPEYFFFARGCRQNGREELVQSLVNKSAISSPRLPGVTLVDELANRLRWDVFQRTKIEFQFTSIRRRELLAKFEWIDRKLHDDWMKSRRVIDEPVRILKIMIAEDEAHARSPQIALDKLPFPDRVRELIYRLRDQNGPPHDAGMRYSIVVPPETPPTPMDELFRLGPKVVPQLIDAIDDKRFTRWVFRGDSGILTNDVTVMPVGRCALYIIADIAREKETLPEASYDAETPEDAVHAKQVLRDWWADLQSKKK